jgi:hypothetical protein
MSAVLTPPPSALLRRPAPAAQHAPAQPLRVRFAGQLLEDAHSATEPATGRAAFCVVIGQGSGNPDIIATRWVGDGPDAAIYARDRATELSAGAMVEVHGEGLRMRYHHGALAVSVCNVLDIERIDGARPTPP